jgi:NADH dehydrogenase (ubiquinone) 1 beta subcomplex subunit 8
MWSPDVANIAPSTALKQLSLAILGFVTFGLVVKATVPARPSIPREYPFSGLVNELGGLEENKVRFLRLRA